METSEIKSTCSASMGVVAEKSEWEQAARKRNLGRQNSISGRDGSEELTGTKGRSYAALRTSIGSLLSDRENEYQRESPAVLPEDGLGEERRPGGEWVVNGRRLRRVWHRRALDEV